MPEAQTAERGGAVTYRTVRVGKGTNRRYLRVAIVRKKGSRGAAAAGPPQNVKRG